MPNVSQTSLRAALAIFPLALILTVAPAKSSLAATGKLVVVSPADGAVVAGKQRVRARLSVRSRARVTKARFYVQGQLVSTDTRSPFTIARSAVLDTSSLPAGANKLRLKVKFSVRRRSGGIATRTLRKTLRVHVFHPPTPTSPLPANWHPIFNDDFTTAASSSNWQAQRDDWLKNGTPYSNLEGAGYLPANVNVANGALNISTSSRAAAGYSQSTGSVNTNKKFSFKYGYIEARLLVPACSGCWPAFWMLPTADHWPPEIDIIEFFDTTKQVIPYSAVHWPVPGPAKEKYFSQRLQVSDFDNYVGTWHTYGMLWTRSTIQFYVDGNPGPQFSDQSKIPHLPMYPIIQLAVGAGYRPAAGSTMQVDHVRAWRRVKQASSS